MKRTIRIIMALAIAMSVITKIYADQNQLQFRHIDTELGLSSNTVNHIIQDKKGFIWIGTDEGLDRIDGTSIKVFKPNINYAKFSMSNVVMLHLQDSEGKIWTSSLFDVFVFDPNIGRFIKFETKTLKGEQLTADITSVAEDHSKNIWFATRSKGIFCYNLNNKKLKRYDINKHAIYSILVDENNQIWAATNSSTHPIARFNRPREIFQDVNVRYNDSRQLPQIIYLYEDKFGSVYAGTWTNGLLKFNRNANTLTIEQPSSQTMPMTHMHCLTKADDNNLWIGSDDGLLLYNTTRKSGKLYVKEDNNIITSLSSKFVYEAFQDREGGLWIGTYYGGVNYAPPFQDRFRSFSHSAQQNSVNGNIIAGFCEDENGQIWISSDDGAISCYNPATDLFKVFTSSNSGLSFDNTHAICADGKDIWIGTYTGGISVYNTISGKWRHYKGGNSQNLLYEGSSYAIKKDSHGTLWIGTMLGICKYNYATDDFTRMHQLSSLVIAIEEDNNGNVWFASQGDGLLCYKFGKKKWKEYTCKNSNLPTNQINCLRTDENGILWVGTCEGLYKYDENRMEFIPEEIQGSSKNIQCILSENGLLWITTTNGLICHTPGKHDDRIYLKRDGLRSCQFTMNSGIIASDGQIYIGTDNGFNSFYPSNIKRNEYVAPIVITGLMLMNKEIQVNEDGPLHKSITNLDRIDLRYKDNVITLNFSSLSYCIPEKNQYAYYMEGFDKGWVKAGNRQSATYTNLSPGTYIFHVKGTNNDGVWNEKGTTLKIVIHPPFYLSWWAELLYLIVIGIIVWYIIKYYQKKTERHQQIHIENVKQEKEKELYVAKISFFTMIAHEIRTPVSLIIGPLETILSKNLSDTVRNDLQTIERNSKRLLYLVNQLLDFRKVQQGSVAMRFSYQDVCQLIRVTVERFRPMAEQDGSKIAIKIPDEGIFADIDSEAITKVLSNLLMNAVKYTKDSIVVECYIKDEDQTLLIHVSDNGQGISEEDMKKIFHPFYQGESNKPGTGIGLTIVRNIVELHHGSISVNSKLDQGTTFIVTLPLHQQGISTEEKISTNEISEIPTDIINMERNEKRNDGEKQLLLIVDDNEDMLTFLSQSFVDDYTIMTAENGEQALKLIDDNNFSLIISDWMMPVMDGADLCKAVRRNPLTSHIPFVLLTAKTDLDSKIEGMDTGADIFVEKPFSIHYLKSCIRNLIELRSMLIQKFSKMPLVPIKSIASHSEDERILNQINKIIEDNFSNPDLDVDLLAEKMNISRSSLYTKIKSISNQTPNELIQLLRLKKAAELLLEKKYRMNEICYMVGFNNPSYFSKCFLKQFGKRPSEYI
jgi:signal transduction histidine kinase/ligand-binding sensor domain-containing protein/DNA-binding response OmpR family regulator